VNDKVRKTKQYMEAKGYFDSDQMLPNDTREQLSKLDPIGQQQVRQQAWQNEGILNKGKRFLKDVVSDDVNEIKESDRRERIKAFLNKQK
jgi:hypothetical protein